MEYRKCVQCGRDFVLTDGEISFYKEKGLSLPKRCKECREKNKAHDNSPEISRQGKRKIKNRFTLPAVAILLIALLILATVTIIPKLSEGFGKVEISDDVSVSQNSVLDPVTDAGHTVNSTPSYYGKDDSGDENFTISGSYSGSEEDPGYSGSNSGNSSYSGYQYSNNHSASEDSVPAQSSPQQSSQEQPVFSGYTFRSSNLLSSHFAKHGSEVGATSETQYVRMANNVINTADQRKKEKEDNDDIYFKSSTGEFVIVSTDGYIRTYYITNQAYFDRQ